MSPRRNRRIEPPSAVHAERARHGVDTVETWPDGEWRVRAAAGSAGKAYRCPGCDQEISPGTRHLVCWPADGSVDERRHWHTACWRARLRRSPVARRYR